MRVARGASPSAVTFTATSTSTSSQSRPALTHPATCAASAKGVARYRQLVDRLNAHLAADDATRTAAVPAIESGVEAFRAATDQLAAVRSAVSLARTAVETAEDAFDRVLEKTYAALVDRFGRKAAERYFPRAHRRQEEPAEG